MGCEDDGLDSLVLEVASHGKATALLASVDVLEHVVSVRRLLETASSPSHHLHDHPEAELASGMEPHSEVEGQPSCLSETVGPTTAVVE